MSLNATALNLAINAVCGAGTWISMHTADPGTTGASEVSGGSYARQQTTWAAANAGSRAGSQVTVPVPAGTSVTNWGLWSAQTGGTFYGGYALPATESFGSAGNEQLTPTLTFS